MAQELTALAALLENPDLIPKTLIAANTPVLGIQCPFLTSAGVVRPRYT